MDVHRYKVQMLAQQFLEKSEPLGWFEAVYAGAEGDALTIPWANLEPNPHLVEWLYKKEFQGEGKKVLVVGCGLGDDAEYLAKQGFDVTAFDISTTAVEWCRKRFRQTKVHYCAVDLFNPDMDWYSGFDFVFEAYTLQSLPQSYRKTAMEQVARFAALDGTLLIVTRGKDLEEDMDGPPWPMVKAELGAFKKCGLREESLEDYPDHESPPVRRFRAVYTAVDSNLHKLRPA